MINEKVFELKKNGEPKSICYCRNPELIENYDRAIADTDKTWICHHKLEAWFTHKELKEMRKYYDRPARELIFLETEEEHQYWPHKGNNEKGKKISKINTGKKASKETKTKMSISHKGKNTWNTEKNSGRHWFNNGKVNVFRYECPEGFVPGMLQNYK